jgi:hypothetical protein
MLALAVLLLQGCGSTESPLQAPLMFLARHQNPDGSWGAKPAGCRCRPPAMMNAPLKLAVDPQVETEFLRLLVDLEDDESIAREQAHQAILRLGAAAIPLLQEQRDHSAVEVRHRCREILLQLYDSKEEIRALFRKGESDLQATSLAIFAFMGSGYSSLSKDQYRDRITGQPISFGDVIGRAVTWLLQRQDKEGSFSRTDPLGDVMAALALVELYGMTALKTIEEPAKRAFASARRIQSTDSRVLLWKGLLMYDATVSEIEVVPGADLQVLALQLSEQGSTLERFGNLLLRKLGKDPTVVLQHQIADLPWDELTPEDFWIATTAALKIWGHQSSQWKAWSEGMPVRVRSAPRDARCDLGSWAPADAGFEERLRSSAFHVLLLHRYYRYANALLWPWEIK